MLSTTELLVEHIISGILSLVWLVGLVFCFIDFDWGQFVFIKEYWVVLTLFIIAIAYPLGIFTDTVADKLLSSWDKKIKLKYYNNAAINILLLLRKASDANITNYFTYNRFKIRIARSSFLNFSLIALIVPMFLWSNQTHLGLTKPYLTIIFICLLFILLAASSLFVWKEATQIIHKKTGQLWGEV